MKKTVLFMVTNGAGLGHLTRGLAVAQRMKMLEKELRIIFYTTSLATELIRERGYMYFYTPTKKLLPKTISNSYWNSCVKRQLQEIFQIYQPSAVIFDGAYPYVGLLGGMIEEKKLIKIWIKREGDREQFRNLSGVEACFDLIIVPGEWGTKSVGASEKRKVVNPILLVDCQDAYPRQRVREIFQIDDKKKIVYLQLGAGVLDEIESKIRYIIKQLLIEKDIIVLLAESVIGKRIEICDERVIPLHYYPNAVFFHGIDLAVSAAGYNTFHELQCFQVPSIFLPNLNTVKDNQLLRAKRAEKLQSGVCLEELSEFPRALQEVKEKVQGVSRSGQNLWENGAINAARYILERI